MVKLIPIDISLGLLGYGAPLSMIRDHQGRFMYGSGVPGTMRSPQAKLAYASYVQLNACLSVGAHLFLIPAWPRVQSGSPVPPEFDNAPLNHYNTAILTDVIHKRITKKARCPEL